MARLRVVPCSLRLCFGSLNNGSNAGLRMVNANNALSTGNWNYLLRLLTRTYHCVMQRQKWPGKPAVAKA